MARRLTRGPVALATPALVLALLAASPGTAWAHGGRMTPPPPPPFVGPNGRVPPGGVTPPGDPTPPPPGGGAPSGPVTPNGPSNPDGPDPRPARTPRDGSGRGGRVAETSDWRDWWDANADALRGERPRRVRVTTDGALGGIGGGAPAAGGAEPPSRRTIETTILPTLRSVLATTPRRDADTIASAMIALCKATDDPADAVRVASALGDRALAEMDREAAVIALGCLRRTSPPPAFDGAFYDRIRATLFEALDEARPSSRSRSYAALALGLLGDQAVAEGDSFAKDGRLAVRGLWMRLEDPATDDETAVAILVGLSLQRPAGVPGAVHEGLRRLAVSGDTGRRRRGSLVRAHALLALARLGDEQAARLATTLVRGSGVDPHVRRSAVLALGLLAPSLDAKERETLAKALLDHARGGEPNTAGLALLSAARLVAAEFAEGRVSPALLSTVEALVAAADHGAAGVRSFAAIATGIAVRPRGRALDEAAFVGARDAALDALRAVYADEGEDPVLRGAFAIGLGIAVDRKARPLFEAQLVARGGSPELLAYVCAGLGLLGDVPASSLAALRAVLAERSSDDLRREASRALGLLGDTKAVPGLVAELEAGGSDHVVARAVLALGEIRDVAAVAPLCALARKPGATDATRALACAGLGLLSDPEPVPSLARLGIDSNYLARTSALDEAVSLL